MDDSSRIGLTRRQALTAIGSIGVASAGAGLGTSAYFSDRETFENNRLTAGTLDMKVAATEYYSDWSPDEAEHAGMAADPASTDIRLPAGGGSGAQDLAIDIDGDSYAAFFEAISTDADGDPYGRVNGGVSAAAEGLCGTGSDADGPVIVDIDDVKPGDFGGAQFAFELCDNPGYVWLTGGLRDAAENGVTEPEADDPDEEEDVVELLDEIQVAYGAGPINGDTSAFEDTDAGFQPVEQHTLREFLGMLGGGGVPLTGDVDAGTGGGTGEQGCFSGGNPSSSSVHHVSVVWWLPTDHGNEVQSDSVTFDLGFYAEQCRHNDGVSLSTDLLAHYPLDTDATDVSGNGYDGTLVGDVSFGAGQVASAATVDKGDRVLVSHNGALTDLTAFTASAWFRPTADGLADQVVFGIRYGYEIVFDSAGQRTGTNNSVWWAIDNGTGDWTVNPTGAGPLALDEWHHAALVQDPDDDEVRVYVDGSLVATDEGTGPVNATTGDLGIGARGDGFGQLVGAVDDVRLYGRALSAGEVESLYDAT